jgi:hypothetical protein
MFMQQDYVFHVNAAQLKLDIDNAEWNYVNIETSSTLPADQLRLHLEYSTKTVDSFRAPSISLVQVGDIQILKITNNSAREYDESGSDYLALTIKLPADMYLLATSQAEQKRSIYQVDYIVAGNIDFQYQSSDYYSVNELYNSERYFSFNGGQQSPDKKCLDELRGSGYGIDCKEGYVIFAEPADMEILQAESLILTLTDRNIVLKKK